MPRKIKICGMREPENIRQVLALQPDFMGLLFYPASPRYVQEPAKLQAIFKRPRSYALTGVFVNEDLDKLLEIVRTLDLDFVQLHGNENPSYCQQLKTAGINIIKAFPIAEPADFEQLHQFEKIASYFLLIPRLLKKVDQVTNFPGNYFLIIMVQLISCWQAVLVLMTSLQLNTQVFSELI